MGSQRTCRVTWIQLLKISDACLCFIIIILEGHPLCTHDSSQESSSERCLLVEWANKWWLIILCEAFPFLIFFLISPHTHSVCVRMRKGLGSRLTVYGPQEPAHTSLVISDCSSALHAPASQPCFVTTCDQRLRFQNIFFSTVLPACSVAHGFLLPICLGSCVCSCASTGACTAGSWCRWGNWYHFKVTFTLFVRLFLSLIIRCSSSGHYLQWHS